VTKFDDGLYEPAEIVARHLDGDNSQGVTSLVMLWTGPGGNPLGFLRCVNNERDAKELATRLREMADSLDGEPAGDDLQSLMLSHRTMLHLRELSVGSVKELCGYSEADLLRTANIGRKSLNEIKHVLSIAGRELRA
jgi:hypothetical protein